MMAYFELPFEPSVTQLQYICNRTWPEYRGLELAGGRGKVM